MTALVSLAIASTTSKAGDFFVTKNLSSCFKPSKIAPNALPSRPKLMARQYK
jgi:hypothetical protein